MWQLVFNIFITVFYQNDGSVTQLSVNADRKRTVNLLCEEGGHNGHYVLLKEDYEQKW